VGRSLARNSRGGQSPRPNHSGGLRPAGFLNRLLESVQNLLKVCLKTQQKGERQQVAAPSPSLRSTPYATLFNGDKTMRCMVLWAYLKQTRRVCSASTDGRITEAHRRCATPRPGSPKQDAEGCRDTPVTPPNHSGGLHPAGLLNRLSGQCHLLFHHERQRAFDPQPHSPFAMKTDREMNGALFCSCLCGSMARW
jgi:hypothetical protein